MNLFKKIYYLYKINKDKKQGKKLASYTSVCNDLSISDCCLVIRVFCKRQIEKVPDAPPYYFFDGDDKDNLIENNYPNYWYFRLGFLIVAELGINEYNAWKNEFDARIKEFVFPCLRNKSLYDNLCQSVWYHKYQSISVSEKYEDYKELYRHFDDRPTIYRVAEYSRKLDMTLFTLHDVYSRVRSIKIFCRYFDCKNTHADFSVEDQVLFLSEDSPYYTKIKLCNNPIQYDCNGCKEYDFKQDISYAINNHYRMHPVSIKSCEGKNLDISKCYQYLIFEIMIDYD